MNEIFITSWDTFVIFARLYPHEAYETDPDRFQIFMKTIGYDLTKSEIENLLESTINKNVQNN